MKIGSATGVSLCGHNGSFAQAYNIRNAKALLLAHFGHSIIILRGGSMYAPSFV